MRLAAQPPEGRFRPRNNSIAASVHHVKYNFVLLFVSPPRDAFGETRNVKAARSALAWP